MSQPCVKMTAVRAGFLVTGGTVDFRQAGSIPVRSTRVMGTLRAVAKVTIELQPDKATRDQLDRIEDSLVALLGAITDLGVQMSQQSEATNAALDAMNERISVDVNFLLQQVQEANQRALDAAANDAADAEQIAALQAEVDQANADAQAAVDRINSVDPLPDNPPPGDGGAEPPPGG